MHLFRFSCVPAICLATTLAAQQRGATAAPPTAPPAQAPAPDPFRFQMMGPAEGGRIASISGVPGDPKIWYVGAASGGVWKSIDSGATFLPVSDSMPVQAIGALAVAPSKPSIVWAGTGEAWAIRDADLMGDGIYKSVDAGKTWANMGLAETGRIGRIVVHPTNPDIVYVCALGRATGPQQEHGVYRTTDGGKTWKLVLGLGGNIGCSGLSLDVQHPNVVFAGMWNVIMHTYAMYSGGDDPKAGIYVTRDGGETWKQVVHPALPKAPQIGKIDVAVAPTNSKRVYALIQTADQGAVWRSDDGGVAWKLINRQRPLIGRAGYYINVKVSSGNADEILIANSSFFRSTDGGASFQEVPWGGDNHDIWIDPKDPNHFGLTNDAGARLTTNHGKTFQNVSLAIGQMYHVAVDNQVPYWIYSNRQDNSTMRGPSTAPEARANGGRGGGGGAGGGRGAGGRGGAADSTARPAAGRGGRIIAQAPNAQTPNAPAGRGVTPQGAPAAGRGGAGPDSANTDGEGGGGRGAGGPQTSTWDHNIGGCESGFTLPDLKDPNIVWASCYGNTVTRYDHRTKRARSVSPWIHTLDSPPDKLKYRCHWTPPLATDPFDHNTVYYGCQVVFKTSNDGQSWKAISPDLSTQDPSRVVSSGGIVEDNLGQFYGEVVFAIAPSEVQRGLIWAGTNDGKVWYTPDGGDHWNDASAALAAAGMPTWGTVRKIEPSHFDPAVAYVAVDFHMMDNRKPYIFKTTDFGKTWKNITGDLPATHPLDYVMAVAENPNHKEMLFAGTGHGFYYSLDDGSHWTQFNAGLPQTAVSWIVVPKLWHDVVVSTYGRGVYILRDIAPLEALADANVAKSDRGVTLYAPHPAFRQARTGRADFTFKLDSASRRPARLEVLDSSGKVIRTLQSPTHAGYNRVVWDLRYDAPRVVAMRTPAPDNPNIFDDPRFKGRPTRPVIHWGIQGAQRSGPIAPPGAASVRLSVNGATLTQPFTILKDAEVDASEADLASSTSAQIRVRDGLNAAADMVNRLEVMRKQILDQQKENAGKADLTAPLAELEKKMMEVELMLLTRSDMNSDDKYYVEQYKVYLNFIWLNGEIGNGAGDVAGGAEFAPTEASMSWLASIEKDLGAAKAAYNALMEHDVAAFNKAMTGKLAPIGEQPRPVP